MDSEANSLTKMESDLQSALKGQDWNELYGEIDFLKTNLENMSFDDAVNRMVKVYEDRFDWMDDAVGRL